MSNIAKNAIRDSSSGAVVFTDTAAAQRARIRNRRSVDQRNKDRTITEMQGQIDSLRAMVEAMLNKGN